MHLCNDVCTRMEISSAGIFLQYCTPAIVHSAPCCETHLNNVLSYLRKNRFNTGMAQAQTTYSEVKLVFEKEGFRHNQHRTDWEGSDINNSGRVM